jgi:hypothetical protein
MLPTASQTMQPAVSSPDSLRISIGRRDVGASSQQFQIIEQLSVNRDVRKSARAASGMQLSIEMGRMKLSGAKTLDGEYLILVGG